MLDTHVVIWWLLDEPRLSQLAIEAIRSMENEVYVSAATGWEIATKVRSGRLPKMAGRVGTFVEAVTSKGFIHLAVEALHGLKGGLLEGGHKDPFDRLLAAQALLENMTLVTIDRKIAAFGCEVLW